MLPQIAYLERRLEGGDQGASLLVLVLGQARRPLACRLECLRQSTRLEPGFQAQA